jgi:acetylornithine deacetylase/succinyl-diaminopimelate desuccinylase-like protein
VVFFLDCRFLLQRKMAHIGFQTPFGQSHYAFLDQMMDILRPMEEAFGHGLEEDQVQISNLFDAREETLCQTVKRCCDHEIARIISEGTWPRGVLSSVKSQAGKCAFNCRVEYYRHSSATPGDAVGNVEDDIQKFCDKAREILPEG